MTGEELEVMLRQMREKLENSKNQRNLIMTEKDMIHDFYKGTRDEIKQTQAEIRNYDGLMQRDEEAHETLV